MKPCVVVTGGCIRLGRAIADAFAAAGWRVIRCSHRADAQADVVADLSQPEGAEQLVSKVRALLGRSPDVLVNNAALYVGAGSDEATWQVNYQSPKRLAEAMDSGCVIVDICDKFAVKRHPGTAYAASKQALAVWSRNAGHIAFEIGDILDLAPTSRREKALENAAQRLTSEEIAQRILSLVR